MSCTIETIIACDICGENCSADDRAYSAKRIRADRAKEGWVYHRGEDFCPQCAGMIKDQARKSPPDAGGTKEGRA